MNKPDKYLVIVNPNAGGGKFMKNWQNFEELFEKADFESRILFTDEPREAIHLTANNINEEYKNVIVVGGDGTINEVVNGIFLQDEIATNEISLGAVLIGTGNDWGKMFNIPKKPLEAIKVIERNKKFIQDVGIVSFQNGQGFEKRYFVNAAGLGFDALVTKSTNRKKVEGKSSTFSYIKSLLSSLFKYRNLNARIEVKHEGEIHDGELFTLSIGIGKYTGGGMQQTPNAVPDDGLFDLMMVEKIAKFKLIRKISRLYNGKIDELKEVKTLKTSKLKVESDSQLLLEIDGESVGHGPFEFDLIPKALNIIVN